MRRRFFDIAFTSAVKAEQERHRSRTGYARLEGSGDALGATDALGLQEINFVSARDSFYLGTCSETGWPQVQHRGGPTGFVRVVGGTTLAWADYSGNRQYVSIGNVAGNDRVALFFMDYAARARLKVLGRMTAIEAATRTDLAAQLTDPGYDAKVEHFMLVHVEAFDWNCPQHITPRFTVDEFEEVIAPLRRQITDLMALQGREDGPS